MLKFAIILASLAGACHGYALLEGAVTRNMGPNFYYLYTRANPFTPIPLQATAESISNSAINENNPTIILVHGHSGNAFGSLNPLVKEAILTVQEANVIVVDWSIYAGLNYDVAVTTVGLVARNLAAFIEELVKVPEQGNPKAKLNELHLVGFGLGAHVLGMTGRVLNGAIGRITGLDPSKTYWEAVTSGRLRITDALYVEVIHTDGRGVLGNGIGIPLGQVDFFPTGGTSQPGCFNNACFHERAFELFAASMINPNLVGYPCQTMTQVNFNQCSGFPLRMGGTELSKLGRGMYRVNTGRVFPF